MPMLPDPELAAAEVLARAEVARPPVEPTQLAGLWPDLRVKTVALDGPGYLLDVDGRIGELLLRRDDPPSRRRYTCAHELGHWVLARHPDAVSVRATHAETERWCDRFAVSLLMPSSWVVRHLAAARLAVQDVAATGARFGVSMRAAMLRVSEVAPVDVGVVALGRESGKLIWSSARDEHSRFDWVDLDRLARLVRVSRTGLVACQRAGVVVRAMAVGVDRWIVIVFCSEVADRWLMTAAHGDQRALHRASRSHAPAMPAGDGAVRAA